MRTAFKSLLAAATMAGAAIVASAPAKADGFGISFGPGGGISFSVSSGGYCDRWGCPDDYWGYPVYYGPVFWGGQWFNGPLYYRYYGGSYWYWVHGGWRRDEWRGPRPGWWRGNYRYGPALSLDYYRSHGFHVRDRDWDRYRVWSRTHNWDRDHRDWSHGHDWNGDRRFDNRVNHNDWNRGNDRHDNDHPAGFIPGRTNNDGGGNDHHDRHTGFGGGTFGNNANTNNGGGGYQHDRANGFHGGNTGSASTNGQDSGSRAGNGRSGDGDHHHDNSGNNGNAGRSGNGNDDQNGHHHHNGGN